jgi:hypothetical protein
MSTLLVTAAVSWYLLVEPRRGNTPQQAGPFASEAICVATARFLEPGNPDWWSEEERTLDSIRQQLSHFKEAERQRTLLNAQALSKGLTLSIRRSLDNTLGVDYVTHWSWIRRVVGRCTSVSSHP